MTPAATSLEAALERCLPRRFRRQRSIVALKRAPSAYGSSFALEDLTVLFDDSTTLQLVFKNLGSDGFLPEAKLAKPAFIHDPMREIRIYQTILAAVGLDTARCYGFIADAAENRYWLFLEKVPGLELYQFGEFSVWARAAEWLARMHRRGNGRVETWQSSCRLLNYNEEFYETWLSRARRFCPDKDAIDWIADRYDRVVRHLCGLPASFIHGEFYASNVIVADSGGQSRICPIDWEMAARGPGLMDLAALTAGKWGDSERRQLALAYRSAMEAEGQSMQPEDAFLESVEYCRMHLCIQWLGWAPHWSPPKEHAQNWLGEVLNSATRIGL